MLRCYFGYQALHTDTGRHAHMETGVSAPLGDVGEQRHDVSVMCLFC